MNWLLVATSLMTGGLPAPDAQVADFIAPDVAGAGETIQVYRQIDDGGEVDADIPYSYYLSVNGTVSTNDLVLPFADGQDVHVVHVDARGSDLGYDTLLVPATVEPGASYTIGLVLDPMNVLDESSEDNNVAVEGPLAMLAAPLSVGAAELPDAVAGDRYVNQFAARGGDGSYRWSLMNGTGALPEGLQLDASGLLSGTPTDAAIALHGGLYFFGVRVASGAATYPAIFILRVVERGPLTIFLFENYLGLSLVAEGGTPPYTWDVKASGGTIKQDPEHPNVITGLSFADPTAPSIEILARVTDALGVSRAQAFRIPSYPVIRGASPGIRILTGTLQPAVTGEEYEQGYLDAENGEAQSYRWEASPLPPGMVLDANSQRGKIHGVPTEIGVSVIQVSVVDGDGNRATTAVGLEVRPVDYLHSRELKSATRDTLYSDAIKVDGGTEPVVYQIVDGQLPQGLVFAADGTIRGTVDAGAGAGAHTFAVEARDAVHHVGRAAFSVYVDNPIIQGGGGRSRSGCSSSGSSTPSAGALLALSLVVLASRRARS